MRLDTIVAVAGILAVLFASIAKTHFATNLLGLAGWLSYTLGVIQQAAIELYGPANAAARGIVNPTLAWLASILAYLLFLIPVAASWQLWREWSGLDVRRWRLRTAGIFLLIPVIAMAPWFLMVSGIPAEVLEYASASRNLSGVGSATGSGWDDAVLITSFVAGIAALLAAAWLASRNTPGATPSPSEQSVDNTVAGEPADSDGAKSTHTAGRSSNAKLLAIGGTAAVLLFSLAVLPSEQPSPPLTAAQKAANNAAAIAGVRSGDRIDFEAPQTEAPSPGPDSSDLEAEAAADRLSEAFDDVDSPVLAPDAALPAAPGKTSLQTQPPRITQIGLSSTFTQEDACFFRPLRGGGDFEAYGEFSRREGHLRISINAREYSFPVGRTTAIVRRSSTAHGYSIDVSPVALVPDTSVRARLTVTGPTGTTSRDLSIECNQVY